MRRKAEAHVIPAAIIMACNIHDACRILCRDILITQELVQEVRINVKGRPLANILSQAEAETADEAVRAGQMNSQPLKMEMYAATAQSSIKYVLRISPIIISESILFLFCHYHTRIVL